MILSTIGLIYMMLKLKHLINNILKTSIVDQYLTLFLYSLTALSIISIIWGVTDPRADGLFKEEKILADTFSNFLAVMTFLAYGILPILWGRKIRKASAPRGHLYDYGTFQVVSGISMLSLIGIFIYPLMLAFSYFFLAAAFFKAKDLQPFAEPSPTVAPDTNTPLEQPSVPLNILFQKIAAAKAEKQSAEKSIEKIFNSLSLEEYRSLREEVTRYLPKNLSEEEIHSAIRDFIRKAFSPIK